MMSRYPTLYAPKSIESYCPGTDDAHAATGLAVPSAIARVQKTLSHWPDAPTAAQRRHLAALFLAAGTGTSALTQWLQLPEPERHPGNGLDKTLVKHLDALKNGKNEDAMISAPLAARLGLQRVFPIDDHTGDAVSVADVKVYAAAIRNAWTSARSAQPTSREKERTLEKSGDMLALYRRINRPDQLRARNENDVGANLRHHSPAHYGRKYAAGWETRNLRMAANILATFRTKPGARVLVIVGSNHKLWLDNILGQMPGIKIMDAEKALGATGRQTGH